MALPGSAKHALSHLANICTPKMHTGLTALSYFSLHLSVAWACRLPRALFLHLLILDTLPSLGLVILFYT